MKLKLSTQRQPSPQDLSEQEARLLEQLADKLICYCQKVGLTPEDLVSLLDSGVSIGDLLAFLASKPSGAA